MSASNYAIVPAEEIQRMKELTPAAFRLLMFLRLCRNSTTGKCCPSLQLCAEYIDVHPKNVFKIRKELSEKKFLEFNGNDVKFLISAKGSKNATASDENKEDDAAVAKTLPNGSENATAVAKTLPESPKHYPMVAKTLPNGSENATAYKEEHTKEHTKEHTAAERAREDAPMIKPAAADRERMNPLEPDEADPASQAIEAMNAAVFAEYGIAGGTITQEFESRAARQVGQLIAMGATVESLKSFFAQRQRLPGLRYLAGDWQEWAVNLNRATNAKPAPSKLAQQLDEASKGAYKILFGEDCNSQPFVDAEVIS